MRQIANLIIQTGDFLMKLPEGARKAIVYSLLLLLCGGGIYKLVISLETLKKPLPAATPEQLIEPMQELFNQTRTSIGQYQQARQVDIKRLDSLAHHYPSKPLTNRP
jgi:hypothetical protein